MYEITKFLKMSKNFPRGMGKRYHLIKNDNQFLKPRVFYLFTVLYLTPIVYGSY